MENEGSDPHQESGGGGQVDVTCPEASWGGRVTEVATRSPTQHLTFRNPLSCCLRTASDGLALAASWKPRDEGGRGLGGF